MPNKHNKIIFYMLVFGIFGPFLYWASSDIPLPKNAKKVGDMIHIDISEGATNETEKKEALFIVPERFKPRVSEGVIAFYFKYPDATPYTGNESPVPFDSVRVVIGHHAKIEAARSTYILLHTQPKEELLKNVPYLVDSKDGLDTYKFDYGRQGERSIGTYFKFIAKDGSTMLAEDAGDWSYVYRVDRKLSSHIELTFLLHKPLVRDSKHFIEDITAVDNAVHKLVQSFQSK